MFVCASRQMVACPSFAYFITQDVSTLMTAIVHFAFLSSFRSFKSFLRMQVICVCPPKNTLRRKPGSATRFSQHLDEESRFIR